MGSFARFPLNDHAAPPPPGVEITVPAAGATASLSWNASSDDSGSVRYEILRNDRVVATTTARTATVDVEPADRLFVRAADAEGNRSASSPVASVPSVPDAPSGLVANPGDGEVALSWDAVADAASYRVFVDDVLLVTPLITGTSSS